MTGWAYLGEDGAGSRLWVAPPGVPGPPGGARPWDDPEVMAADLRQAAAGIAASGGPGVFGGGGVMAREEIPGWEGSVGPGPGQYGQPHVYARDVGSGAGNCVCGRDLGDGLHVQAAPGVPVPARLRHGRQRGADTPAPGGTP